MPRAPLPDDFRSGAFPVRDAVESGMARNRLRARDLSRPVRGTRRADAPPNAYLGRLQAFAVRLGPNVFFSHVTAARLLGIPLPLALERSPLVHVAVHSPARAPHATGLRGHRLHPQTRVVSRSGLRVSSPADTWRDLASMLSMIELVAAGDRIIHHRTPLASRAHLDAVARASVHRRGAVSMRAALPLLSDRAESPPESELRVILALAGLPAPTINYVVVKTETGHDARVDFAFPPLKFAIEYQGDYHRSTAQWRKDMTRRTGLEIDGWYVMEVNADDLRRPENLIARIRRVLTLRGRPTPR